jgi:glutathione S-transferase
MVLLYDLINARGAHFSPNGWRVRMALLHKGIPFEVRDVRFVDLPAIDPGGQKVTIPTIAHQGRLLTDSWAIVQYLDEAFPQSPRLLAPGAPTALLRFFQYWVQTQLHGPIARLILKDLHDRLDAADQAYFRSSRERLYKTTLEDVQAGRDERLDAFRRGLQPMRLMLAEQPFLGGAQPGYADYLAFGAFMWARTSSPYALLAEDDAVYAWRERCLDLYDGAGRREPQAV